MTAAIAAFRAGNAPHMLQVFEVGTATMMAAKGAIVPVAKVMTDAEASRSIRRPTCRRSTGYYTDPKGNMLSFPFNSSTVMFYINKDAFKKAGLDPNKPPKTWKEVVAAAEKLKASGHACAYTTSWPSWMHIENFSAWHNVPIGTKENGFGGLDTQFAINSPLHVQAHQHAGRHVEEGPVHLRRPHQPGRRRSSPAASARCSAAAPARRPASARRASSSGRSTSSRTTTTSRARRRTRSSAARRCG